MFSKSTQTSRKAFSFAFVLLLAPFLITGNCSRAMAAVGSQGVDYKAAEKEAVDILSGYLQVDTTVPPGNEKKGALFLKKVLEKEGIKAQILETAPGRACVYARLKGTGKKKAIILLNHIDVVPAEASDWKYPPFGGEVHEGELWGRGALDMKGMGIIELMAMILLKRSGVKLDRDIIFLGTPDEEVGGEHGAGWFKKNKADLVADAEFLLNEGFPIDVDDNGKQMYWGVDYAEKSPIWLELSTEGAEGHGSMPIPGSSTVRLVRALNRIADSGPNFKVLPAVADYFSKISKRESQEKAKLFADIAKSVQDPKNNKVILSDLLKSSMLRNTISLTVMKAGYKTNVIPARASAQLDCRLLPGVGRDEFVSWIKGTIKDDQVNIKVLEWDKSEPSKIDTELFDCIKAVAREEAKDVPVVPVVVPWFTDSHWFRELGVTAYGFQPIEVDKTHMATMHGRNERIPVKVLGNGVRRMHKILYRLCAADN